MIYKVLFQESNKEVPVRERTKSVYIEAESERDVRRKLADRPYNIELVQEVSGAFLDYEQQSINFKMENV